MWPFSRRRYSPMDRWRKTPIFPTEKRYNVTVMVYTDRDEWYAVCDRWKERRDCRGFTAANLKTIFLFSPTTEEMLGHELHHIFEGNFHVGTDVYDT